MTAMPLALADTLASAGLPAAVRTKRDLLAAVLAQVEAATHGSKRHAYEAAALQMRAAGFVITWHGLRAIVARQREEGHRAFIDKRKVPHDEKKGLSLPASFKEEVKRRFQRHGASDQKAYDAIIAEWRSGKPVPGYPISPKADPYTGQPRGWSLKNLQRVAKSSAFEKATMRIGLGYAKAKHAPKMFGSRVGLYPMSHLMFDDVFHDNFVHVLTKNHRQLCRVAEIGCLDVLSGSRFTYGSVPLLKRKDGSTEGLKEHLMRFLVASVLYRYGYSPRGTSLIVERGTATLREDIIALLHDRTEGLLTVDKGGWTGKEQAVPGMFMGSGGGNPRHKSHLESFHHLAHNVFAALPAYTGPDVPRRPEFLDGALKESNQLLRVAGQLTPWQIERLKFPTLEYFTEFLPIARDLYRLIDLDSNHELEGWEKLGYLTRAMRFHRESLEWIDEQKFLALPGPTQSLLTQAVKADTACQQVRKLSRGEVFARGMNEIVPAPIGLIAEILYADLAKPRASRNSYFEFQDEEIECEALRYESRVRTVDGRETELPDDTYEVVANPFDLSQLWVYSGKRGQGAFLGLSRRVENISRADRDATKRALGRQQQRTSDLRAPLLARHAQIAAEETRRLKHNNDVISGPRSPEELRAEQTRAETVLTDDDLRALSPASDADPVATDAPVDLSDISTKDFI
jgi:hypothetical protein